MTTNGDSAAPTPFRVLALDGGGIRGYYTARVLERLVAGAGGDPQRFDLGRMFDLIVGTSTGSLIGAALAAGVPLTRISALYRDRGAAIFPHPAPTGRWSLLWCAAHWRRASGDVNALRRALDGLLGDMTLGGLYAQRGIALCVTATDAVAARGRVFATPHLAIHSDHAALRLVDACVASSSAPMLLPPAQLPRAGTQEAFWCDGGLWATSPIAVAIDEAIAATPDERPIEILSVGTCATGVPRNALADSPGTGIGLWIRGLRALQVACDAQALATVDFACRLAPLLRPPIRIVRLREPAPTESEAEIVRLDNATPAAFAAMERLAQRAAELNGARPEEASPDLAWLAAMLREGVARNEVLSGAADPA